MEEILVSIFCTAYNHEKYIATALQGFVEQKTTFRFEVLVHDDASLDRTADIIREYEKNYPEIIRAIYQTENQYSQDPGVVGDLLDEMARGKYVALCEGDDYWIDPEKLQKQISYMEAHPECSLCFTNGQLEENGILTGRRVIPWTKGAQKAYKPGNSDYNMGEMILLDYVPTASLVYRRDVWNDAPLLSPDSFAGDNYIRYYTTSKGYAHCIDEDTCVYRFGVPNSTSTKWKEDVEYKAVFLDMYRSLLDDMNLFTDYKYDAQIQSTKLLQEFEIAWLKKDHKLLRQKKFQEFYKKQGTLSYIKYFAKAYCPRVFSLLQEIKQSNK